MENWSIGIERMRLRAFHGVDPQERIVGNDFEVSLRVAISSGLGLRVATSDNIDLSVSYAQLADVIAEVMATPVDLLETVAFSIATQVSQRFPAVIQGSVKITKLTPPLPYNMAGASVTYQWDNTRK